MTALLLAVGGYFVAAGIVAVFIGKALHRAGKALDTQRWHIPDTADEFIEVTR